MVHLCLSEISYWFFLLFFWCESQRLIHGWSLLHVLIDGVAQLFLPPENPIALTHVNHNNINYIDNDNINNINYNNINRMKNDDSNQIGNMTTMS